MARSEPTRHWSLDPAEFGFPHRFLLGFALPTGGGTLHGNPTALTRAITARPEWLVLGGTWAAPTVAAVAAAGPLLGSTRLIAWSEANAASSGLSRRTARAVRRRVLNRMDAFALPGSTAERTLFECWGVERKPVLPLPNIVDERLFHDEVRRLRTERRCRLRREIDLDPERVAVLLPARLIERRKGVRNFLSAVGAEVWPGITVVIAGDGPDRGLLEAWAGEHPEASVRLLGHVDEARMTELYAAVDAFALPSFQDPNPLSVIEACWAGLPLLVSSRCGNAPEAVHEGENGWLLDPVRPETIAGAVRALVDAKTRLAEMGARSERVAERAFATDVVTASFLDALERLEAGG